MKYIYAIAFLLSAAYLMKMPVDEAKPVLAKQVKQDPYKAEWEALTKEAERLTFPIAAYK